MHYKRLQAELEEIVQYLREPHKFTTLGGKLPKVRTPGCLSSAKWGRDFRANKVLVLALVVGFLL